MHVSRTLILFLNFLIYSFRHLFIVFDQNRYSLIQGQPHCYLAHLSIVMWHTLVLLFSTPSVVKILLLALHFLFDQLSIVI